MKAGKRGISPLLATIILVGITVAAGLVIYNLFFSTAGTLSTSFEVEITSVDLIKSGSKVLFSVTIKNIGNKPVTECRVSIWDEGGKEKKSSDFVSTLDPGEYASVTLTESNIGSNFVVGKDYPVKIYAKSNDGNTFEKIITVTCGS